MSPFDESALDDAERRAALDGTDMLRVLAGAGAQLRRAVTLCAESDLARVADGQRPRAVHVAAVGGSESVAAVLELLMTRTCMLSTGGSGPLPGWVGTLDLVIGVSLSGRAEGPLRQVREAARRGAHVLTIGAPDSPLAEAAAAARGVHIGIDPGTGHSRTALWSLLCPALLGAAACGVLDLPPSVLLAAADRLDEQAERCRPDAEYFVSPAKMLALDLSTRVPVVLGDGPVTGVAARRASAMLARTARVPATWGRLPDAAAQVVACLSGPYAPRAGGGEGRGAGSQATGRDIFADPYLDGPAAAEVGLLMLRDPAPQAGAMQAEIDRHNTAQSVLERAEAAGVRVLEQRAQPGHEIERLAELIALSDFTSVYLALGHGLDPAHAPGLTDLFLPGKAL